MKGIELIATLLFAVALTPITILSGDILVYALALLIPFVQGMRDGTI